MSEIADPAPAGAPAEAPAEAPPAAAEPPAAATESEAGAKAHGFASVDDAVAELRKVREEAANRRVAFKPYEEAFGAFDEDSRGIYLDLARKIGSGTKAEQAEAAAKFREIAERIEASEAPTTPTGEPDPKQQPLTRGEWEALQEEAKHEASIEQGLRQIEADAASIGITDLYDSFEGANYLKALQMPDVAGDHEKAVAVLEAHRQSIIDSYAKQVAEGAERWPSVAPTGGPPAGDPADAPKTFKEASKRTAALFKARAGQTT